MRLNLHARIEIGLATALLLGSCGMTPSNKFSDEERDEIADIAGDGAVDTEEFATLQNRVEAIEQRLNM